MTEKIVLLSRMVKAPSRAIFKTSLFLTCFITATGCLAQFSTGNLVVLQVGNGVTTLTSTGNPLILNEYNTSGALTYSMTVPSTGTSALVLRGNATSEGYISKSSDGNYVVFGGYVQALPNTSALNSSAPSSISRGVGLVDATGSYSLIASSSATFAAGDVRGATATDNANVWCTSSSQGANYFGNSASATNVESTKLNLRATHIFNNQLYISSQVASGTPTDIGVYTVGSGTPNTSGQTVTTLINTGTSSQPGQFYFNSAGTICYIADARSQSSGGGIQKWVYSSSTWSLAYTLPTGTTSAGAFGVVADFSGLNPKVYATTTESTGNRLVAVLDLGASSTATTLATASTNNTIFRGLAFSPGTSTCVPVSVTTTSNNAPICSDQNLLLNVSAAGSAPISYTWSGTGVFSSTAAASPTITNSSTGTYTVLLSNACGSASTTINVTINPSPTIQVNAASICAGGIATITATGANTYTWNNNSNSPSFTASPASTTIYTVNGTSANGCVANTVTTSITVVSSASLSVNSPTICAGANATLTASGASTYTWSSGQNSGVIVVNPGSTTSYTVSGNAAGCPATVSITTTVIVNPLPTLSLTMPFFCLQQKSVTLVGLPSGGTFAGSFVSGSVFTPTLPGNYTVSYSYTAATSCTNSISQTFTVSNCVGLSGVDPGLSTLGVFPNPASNSLFVKHDALAPVTLIISDWSARKIMEVEVTSEKDLIDISTLAPGMYFIHAVSSEGVKIKFIKE